MSDEKNKIIILKERIANILDGLYDRNKSLFNLVLLYNYFNDLKWLVKLAEMNGKLTKKYSVEEIMRQLECSQRTAYDYSDALDALDMCNRLSDDIMSLLLTSVAKGELKKE